MPQSERALDDLAATIAGAPRREQRERAPELQRYILEDVARWEELDSEVTETLLPLLDAPDAPVRSAAAFVLQHAASYDGVTQDREALAAKLLSMLDDDSPVVRQTVANPSALENVYRDTRDAEFEPVPLDELARTLFDALHDPTPVVRTRVAGLFPRHGEDLLDAHPDTETAIERLVETFEDPVDGLGSNVARASTPRQVALRLLRRTLDDHDDALVARHVDAIAGCLADDDRRVARAAAALLEDLRDRDAIAVEDVADRVVAALEADQLPVGTGNVDRVALAVALARPDAVELAYDRFTAYVSAENTSTDSWRSDDSTLVALSRLVRASDRSFDPPMETLAAIIGRDTTASEDTDPLVLLAPEHPEYVAEELRAGYRKLVAGDLDYNDRFYRDLVVDVAAANPRAIEGVPEILATDISGQYVRKTLTALVEAHPDHAGHVVPEAVGTVDWEPPVRYQVSALVERTAEQWTDVPDDLVTSLVATVEETTSERDADRRRYALRALVALHDQGLAVLPDRLTPFIDQYHAGVFHEDDEDEATDPLETAVAESLGLGDP